MNIHQWFTTATLATAATLAVGTAQAREADVKWSVTIGTPVYAQPVPVYTRPTPVYVQPAPVYLPHSYRQPTRWDRDGDGIANRYDRLYNPVWDRDGDGIPNQRDRFDTRRNDRDGDGIPNRLDRHDGRGR